MSASEDQGGEEGSEYGDEVSVFDSLHYQFFESGDGEVLPEAAMKAALQGHFDFVVKDLQRGTVGAVRARKLLVAAGWKPNGQNGRYLIGDWDKIIVELFPSPTWIVELEKECEQAADVAAVKAAYRKRMSELKSYLYLLPRTLQERILTPGTSTCDQLRESISNISGGAPGSRYRSRLLETLTNWMTATSAEPDGGEVEEDVETGHAEEKSGDHEQGRSQAGVPRSAGRRIPAAPRRSSLPSDIVDLSAAERSEVAVDFARYQAGVEADRRRQERDPRRNNVRFSAAGSGSGAGNFIPPPWDSGENYFSRQAPRSPYHPRVPQDQGSNPSRSTFSRDYREESGAPMGVNRGAGMRGGMRGLSPYGSREHARLFSTPVSHGSEALFRPQVEDFLQRVLQRNAYVSGWAAAYPWKNERSRIEAQHLAATMDHLVEEFAAGDWTELLESATAETLTRRIQSLTLLDANPGGVGAQLAGLMSEPMIGSQIPMASATLVSLSKTATKVKTGQGDKAAWGGKQKEKGGGGGGVGGGGNQAGSH